MEKTFLTLLEISAVCAVVIMAISLLSTVINRRFTAKWKYFIWLIIAVRLLVPFNPTFDIGQPKFEVSIPNTSVVVPIVQTPPLEEPPSEVAPPVTGGQNPSVSQTQPEEKTAVTINLVQILGVLWMIGAVVFWGVHIGAYALFKKKVFRWARPVSRESRVFIIKQRLQTELGISTEVPVLICKDVTSPMMIGFFKAFLILPHEDYSDTELYFIIRHELTHFKRRDIWYKLLMILTNAIHWFNPAVWLMVRESSRDLEISCDSSVVRGADAQSRKLYSEIILANIRHQPKTTVLSTYFYDGKKSLKERFKNILNSKKRQKGLLCFVAVILCIGLIGGVVSCTLASDIDSSSVDSSDGEGKLFYVAEFTKQERFKTWLHTYFPNINDWHVVFEYYSYANEDNLREGGLYEWPKDRSMLKSNCFAVLATEQSAEFDRVLISSIDNYELTQDEDGRWTATPVKASNSVNSPIMLHYRGFESEWQLGDCKDAEFICRTGMNNCGFWFPEKNEALIFADISRPPLRLNGVAEKPDVCRQYYIPYTQTHNLHPEQKDDLLLFFYKAGGNSVYAEASELAFYSGEKLTYLEDTEGYYAETYWLSDTVFAIATSDRVSLYDVSSDSFGKPIKILDGDGYGLADSDTWICSQVQTDKTTPTRHSIMYYIKDEREWRICTFDTNGNILSNFSTGLNVVDETIVFINYIDGLVYFLHYPGGAVNPSVRYCVDARPNRNHTPVYTP